MSVGKKKRKRIKCTAYRISTSVALAHNGLAKKRSLNNERFKFTNRCQGYVFLAVVGSSNGLIMTRGEEQALVVAEKYKSNLSDQDKVKWLAGEVTELARAIENGDEQNIREEIGDCAFLLCHILSRHDPNKGGIITQIVNASEKMLIRNDG